MQRQIADYQLLKFYSISYMANEIMMRSQNGYELCGGPFASGGSFYQAVVKYEDDVIGVEEL